MTAEHSTGRLGIAPCCLTSVVAALVLIVGCTAPAPKKTAPPVVLVESPAMPSNFRIAAGELEAWNAIGQLLVRLPGVTYQGRSQKLGLYAVDYQGESFLVLTRALVASAEVQTLTTDVRVALQDGATDRSAAATELLAILQARLPAELLRIAALPKPPPAIAKKVAKKRSGRRAARR